ncbi:MAG: nicotinate-nucleotide adenylyltransferase [Gammaproteobacteria bacterium]|nr:nicotinate-nucleotide adenylyltransferase [Gammaproteobacteria bacterium]
MIGIMGGAFDPVHYGHLRPAQELHTALALESMRWIPTGQPMHRKKADTSPEHRLKMLQLAIEPVSEWQLDRREIDSGEPSYMVNTLASLREELGDRVPLLLLLGVDAFNHLAGWYHWRQLFELAHIVVSYRPGCDVNEHKTDELAKLIQHKRVDDAAQLRQQATGCILFHEVTQLDISSTAIRSMLIRGQSPRFLLPDAVLEYITHHSLYM